MKRILAKVIRQQQLQQQNQPYQWTIGRTPRKIWTDGRIISTVRQMLLEHIRYTHKSTHTTTEWKRWNKNSRNQSQPNEHRIYNQEIEIHSTNPDGRWFQWGHASFFYSLKLTPVRLLACLCFLVFFFRVIIVSDTQFVDCRRTRVAVNSRALTAYGASAKRRTADTEQGTKHASGRWTGRERGGQPFDELHSDATKTMNIENQVCNEKTFSELPFPL